MIYCILVHFDLAGAIEQSMDVVFKRKVFFQPSQKCVGLTVIMKIQFSNRPRATFLRPKENISPYVDLPAGR